MGFHGFQGELVLEDCEVSADHVLGREGRGWSLALDWINTNRTKLGAVSVGLARRLLRVSTAYRQGNTRHG